MRRYGYLLSLLLACALSGCSSAPPQARASQDVHAYWNNPFWQERLLYAVQSAVHQPDTGTPITGVNGMVRFTVANGAIESPAIVASTGYADLDKLMLQQVASVKPPKTSGPHASEPREFELLLDMLTPFDSFQYNVYRAIDEYRLYPREGIIAGATGNTIVDFDYQDGKANNIAIASSSRNRDLDKAAIGAVGKAILPPAPQAYSGKPVHMEVVFCYSLATSPTDIKNKCPTDKNVIAVEGARIMRTTVETIGFGGY